LQSATEFASFDTSKNSFLLSPDVLAGPCQGDERIGVFQSSVPGLGPAAFCYGQQIIPMAGVVRGANSASDPVFPRTFHHVT
jgi:hypothetical protein